MDSAAPTRKMPADKGGKMCRHLQSEARGCDYLVLWLDCDREGGLALADHVTRVSSSVYRAQTPIDD